MVPNHLSRVSPPCGRCGVYRRGTYLFFQDDLVDTVCFLCRAHGGQLAFGHRALSTPDNPGTATVVTRGDLASLCGGSRENVTRILSEFARRGLVERDGRRFLLKNVSGLGKLAAL